MPFSNELYDETRLGDFNAQNKAAVITLRPEFKQRDEKGKLQIKEFSDVERDLMWLNVVNDIRTLIEND